MALINPMVVDLSLYDREPNDWAVAKAAGLVGVIHKATQGIGYVDKLHDVRRKQVTDAGLLWGSYHFGDASPAPDQVNHFLSVAQPDANTLLALDLEPLDAANGGTMSLASARQWLAAVFAQVGRRPVLYSGNLIKEQLGSTVDPFFGQHRLWLADYNSVVTWQASWKNYWLWQFTDGTAGPQPRSVPGILGDDNGDLDINSYAGTPAQLVAEWAGTVAPASTGPIPATPLSSDARTAGIKELQHALNDLGAQPPLVEDGIAGPKTKAAISAVSASL